MEKQNPGMAAVLSFVFNGLGQIYNGQIAKGLVIMLVSSIAMMVMLIGAVFLGHFIITGFLYRVEFLAGAIMMFIGVSVIIVLGIYNIYDAYYTAQKNLDK